MTIYVYGFVDATAHDQGLGLDGEPLLAVPAGGVTAIVGEMAMAPSIEASSLAAHEVVVRRLVENHDALLPARYGTTYDSARDLALALHPRAKAIAEALERVRGREQMTLRVHGDLTATEAPDDGKLGPGARFLTRRSRAVRLDGLAALRTRLGDLVVGERVVTHDTPPLVASVYHLIPRGRSARYLEAIADVTDAIAPLRVRASGPWPAYGFGPDATENPA